MSAIDLKRRLVLWSIGTVVGFSLVYVLLAALGLALVGRIPSQVSPIRVITAHWTQQPSSELQIPIALLLLWTASILVPRPLTAQAAGLFAFLYAYTGWATVGASI